VPGMKHLRREGHSKREIVKRLEVSRTSAIRLLRPQSARHLSGQGLDLRFVHRLGT
jgi:transposase